jgi:hypothetical protein
VSSLTADFEEVIKRIQQGKETGFLSCEPIYYLIFPPEQILEVKGQTPAWVGKLRSQGWEVSVFSTARQVLDILRSDSRYPLWVAADRKAPLMWTKTNESLTNALTSAGALQNRLEQTMESLQGHDRALVLVTDLEALHPYIRIGAIEGKLVGKFTVPTLFLYPGLRSGTTRLRFLGFYPEDGNYRSIHIGG